MLNALSYRLANALWLASGCTATRAYRRALCDPRRAQAVVLADLLRRNAESDYGRRYGFAKICTPREFQDAVPIVTYDDLTSEIEQIKQGRQGVLTAEPVLMLEKTGGSTAASKYIPYTASLKREFQAAIAPWMADLFAPHPTLRRGGAYWSVSPLATEREVTEGGVPVGFEADTEYFGPLERWCLAQLILTPRELPRVMDMEASRYITLRFLLQTDRLTFISVWSPSFLTLLMAALSPHVERLIADIGAGTLTPPTSIPAELRRALERQLRPRPARACRLRSLLERDGRLDPRAVWPDLSVISCWTDASAAAFVPAVREQFPGVTIQPKGLLATEGVVSIPVTPPFPASQITGRSPSAQADFARTARGFNHGQITDNETGSALAITSHFLEFINEERPADRPALAHELESGRTYRVLLTTGGGLYRYDLGDRVRVTGHLAATPLVEFIGKAAHVSDLCGEKLSEARVRDVLEAAFRAAELMPVFAMLAPEWGEPPGYVLFLETDAAEQTVQQIEAAVEIGLREGHHYDYCRRLGQFAPVQVCTVRDGTERYVERCAALGQRRGSIKPTALHREPGWTAWFRVAPVETRR